MVNADLMDAIDRSLRQARGRRAEPFGGVQVVMFGDPYQLAPVPPRGDERATSATTTARSGSSTRRSGSARRPATASSTSASYGAELHIRELVDIHRQADPAFKAMLNAVRYGRVTADIAQVLNDTGARTPPDPADGEHPIITLATRNDIVNSINRRHLDRARRTRADGDRRDQRRLRPGGCLVPGRRRPQAQGRRAGDVPAQRHAGRSASRRAGSTARSARSPGSRAARCASTSTARSSTSSRRCGRGSATRTTPARSRSRARSWPSSRSSRCASRGRSRSTSRRARPTSGRSSTWAPGAFAPGQTYVALSRLTSLDGLYLSRPLRPSDIRVDPDVQRFMARRCRAPRRPDRQRDGVTVRGLRRPATAFARRGRRTARC